MFLIDLTLIIGGSGGYGGTQLPPSAKTPLPPSAKISSFLWSFWKKIGQIVGQIVGGPLGVGARYGKS